MEKGQDIRGEETMREEEVKEKLAKLIDESKSYANHQCFHTQNVCVECPFSKESNCKKFYQAEYLIQNGVTIATDTNDKWVSVDQRFPTEEELERAPFGRFLINIFGVILEAVYVNGYFAMSGGRLHSVSHWMNYPEPPKETKE